jgi:hypothetical protein
LLIATRRNRQILLVTDREGRLVMIVRQSFPGNVAWAEKRVEQELEVEVTPGLEEMPAVLVRLVRPSFQSQLSFDAFLIWLVRFWPL